MFKSVALILFKLVINICNQFSNLRDFDLRDILYSFAKESGLNRLKLRYEL